MSYVWEKCVCLSNAVYSMHLSPSPSLFLYLFQYHSIDGGCPDEWDGGETYEEADLVSVVVSDGFEEPEVTTRKPTSAPVSMELSLLFLVLHRLDAHKLTLILFINLMHINLHSSLPLQVVPTPRPTSQYCCK